MNLELKQKLAELSYQFDKLEKEVQSNLENAGEQLASSLNEEDLASLAGDWKSLCYEPLLDYITNEMIRRKPKFAEAMGVRKGYSSILGIDGAFFTAYPFARAEVTGDTAQPQ